MDNREAKGIITHHVYEQQLSSDVYFCTAINRCQTGMQPRQRFGMLMFSHVKDFLDSNKSKQVAV